MADPYIYNSQGLEFPEVLAEPASNTTSGIPAATKKAQVEANRQDLNNIGREKDWRVRLSLANNSNYLYNAPSPGILMPLNRTRGVIFPYTPSVSVQYSATYTPADVSHTNYKINQYQSSSVDSISIGCEFTAQDTYEANYLLAVIHFFRSATKMFYGQDLNPKPGTPPPLCYLHGYGQFQFDSHPLAITGFNYQLPTDVDYVRAYLGEYSGVEGGTKLNNGSVSQSRMTDSKLNPGAGQNDPQWSGVNLGVEPTYVPSRIQLSISAIPMMSRNDISNRFSLQNYARGSLLKGSVEKGRGIW